MDAAPPSQADATISDGDKPSNAAIPSDQGDYIDDLVADWSYVFIPETEESRVQREQDEAEAYCRDTLANYVAKLVPAAGWTPSSWPRPAGPAPGRIRYYRYFRRHESGEPALESSLTTAQLGSNHLLRVADKGYAAVSPRELAEAAVANPLANELVDGTSPHRLVLEVDDLGKNLGPEDRARLISSCIGALAEVMYRLYDIDLEDLLRDLAIASSSSDSKLSYHIVYVPKLVIDADEHSEILRLVQDALDSEEDKKHIDIIPKKLFGLRLLGSSKDGRVKLPCIASIENGWTHYEDYLLQPKGKHEIFRRKLTDETRENVAPAARPTEEEAAAVVDYVSAEYGDEFDYRDIVESCINFDRVRPGMCAQCGVEHERDNTLFARKCGDGWYLFCRKRPTGVKGVRIQIGAVDTTSDVAANSPKEPAPPAPHIRLRQRLEASVRPALSAVSYCSPEMRPYGIEFAERLVLVRANCGVGKSKALIDELRHERFAHSSFILIAPSRSLVLSLSIKLADLDFISYQSISGSIDPEKYPRLIITPESLFRLKKPNYEYVILEEVNQLLKCFRSVTMKNPRQCLERFLALTKNFPVIAIDATLSDEDVEILSKLTGATPASTIVHHNTYVREARQAEITTCRDAWLGNILADLKAGMRVVIYTIQSAESAASLHAELTAKGFAGVSYTSLMTEKDRQGVFADLDTTLETLGAQFVIMTPVVTSGVSIERTAYTRAYCDFRPLATVPPSVAFQMAHRVRQVTTGTTRILTDLRLGHRPVEASGIKQYLETMHESVGASKPFEVHCEREMLPNGSYIYRHSPSLDLHIYLLAEENRGRNDFVGELARLYRGAGYSVGLMPSPRGDVQSSGKALNKKVRNGATRMKAEKAEAVAEAATIDADEASDIALSVQKGGAITTEDLAALKKYELAQYYDVAPEKVDAKFVATYDNPRARQQHRAREMASQTLEELRDEHRITVRDSVKAVTTYAPVLPKVIILGEVLEGIGFAKGLWTKGSVPREQIEAAISTYEPVFRQKEWAMYRVLGKKLRQPKEYNLKYFLTFLDAPLKEVFNARLTTHRRTAKDPIESVEVCIT